MNTCTWQTAYGMPWTTVCGKPCRDEWCTMHMQDYRELYPHKPLPKKRARKAGEGKP